MRTSSEQHKQKRKGNYKAGPGRPPGRKNNKTLTLEAATQKALEQVDEAFEGDAHTFLQWVYKNPDFPIEIRLQAATKALRVEKPTLAASHSTHDVSIGLAERLDSALIRASNARRHIEQPIFRIASNTSGLA